MPIIDENNCLLITIGDRLAEALSSSQRVTSKLFYQQINGTAEQVYDIQFMAYDYDADEKMTKENNKRESQVEISRRHRHPYFLSLSEQRWVRYVFFFYAYVMQGVPAGFSGVALANYLTGRQFFSANDVVSNSFCLSFS